MTANKESSMTQGRIIAEATVAALNEKFAAGSYTYVIVPGGRRYIKVAQTMGGASRSVAFFVDAATGDILKAASWKTPAAGVRYAPATATEAHALVMDRADAFGAWLYR